VNAHLAVVTAFYRASRLDNVLEPPAGQEFDPYRDTVYSKLETDSFNAAVDFAKADYHECGRIEHLERRRHITVTVEEWEVYPDGTTRSIQ
jgi:hypothetical protein